MCAMSIAELVSTLDDMPEGWFRGPLPAPFDQTVAKVVDSYIGGDEEERAQLLEGLDTDRSWMLAGYAERAASVAVHERSPEPLVRGLVAIGLAATQLYEKEVLILLPLFWRSAERIGVDGALLFTSAADLLGDAAPEPDWIRAFPDRDERGRSLGAMGYEEREEPNGMLYHRTF
jgi:hypothetical protein